MPTVNVAITRMILLDYCDRCMRDAPDNRDATPNPECLRCPGTGYIAPTAHAKRRYFAEISAHVAAMRRATPRVARSAASG